MIVKILSSTGSFRAVTYNTNKVDQNKGELLKVANFGILQGMDRVRPVDYINYLKMISSLNSKIKKPQFHVALSTKGESHTKEELTSIAEKWLESMGYDKQPYLIIFHKDTKNNHVHIVSTRVDKLGVKISSAFEKINSIQNLNKVLGIDESQNADRCIDKALSYHYCSIQQYKMILERMGYQISETPTMLNIIKSGRIQADVSIVDVKANLQTAPNSSGRIAQIQAIFHKYKMVYDTTLRQQVITLSGQRTQLTKVLTSDFSEFLKQKLGIDLLFHGKIGMPPYGYSIIDHASGIVLKGGEIMTLGDLLKNDITINLKDDKVNLSESESIRTQFGLQERSYFESPVFINDKLQETKTNAEIELVDYQENGLAFSYSEYPNLDIDRPENFPSNSPELSINLADDIDDEATHGRNRQRQKKVKTNTR